MNISCGIKDFKTIYNFLLWEYIIKISNAKDENACIRWKTSMYSTGKQFWTSLLIYFFLFFLVLLFCNISYNAISVCVQFYYTRDHASLRFDVQKIRQHANNFILQWKSAQNIKVGRIISYLPYINFLTWPYQWIFTIHLHLYKNQMTVSHSRYQYNENYQRC